MKLSEHIALSKRGIRLFFYLDKTYALCILSGSLIQALLPYISVYFSAKLIDALIARSGIRTLILYASLTVGLTFVFALLRQWISSLERKGQNSSYRNEQWLFSETAIRMAYKSIEDNEVKLLLERIKMESQTGFDIYFLQECASRLIAAVAQIAASVGLTLSFFMIDTISVSMKLALLAGVALTLCYGVFSTSKTNRIISDFYADCVDINAYSTKYSDYIKDYRSGKDIRLYGMDEMITRNRIELDRQFYRNMQRINIKQALISLPDTILYDLLKYGVYLILIYAALQGSVSVGSIAKYVTCLMMLISAVSSMASAVLRAFVNHHYMKRYFSYLDTPNDMYQGSLTVEKRDDNEYDVEFRDVSFRYPNSESYALRHVNLKFRIGEKLAVVGANGSGKTTFIKLMCRLYDPTEGQILLNGVDIRKYDYDEYMSIFSIVFQDFRLLSLTLGQNVATGQTYRADDVRDCLIRSGFGERLASLPAGTETYLYKNYSGDGVEISGGEAQKIALARALYRDAPFVILDEPTAALDPVSEYEIYSKFDEIVGDKTAIYISHRLASCRFCDKIAVFDSGRIIQTGSHDELIGDENGRYYELWHAQAQYYTE